MTQYMVSVHRPSDYDHAAQINAAVHRDIDMVNEAMKAAGVRVFVGGLRPTSYAKSLRHQAKDEIILCDGPYVEAGNYVDGFWVLECADVDEALAWGRKAATACRASVEVRPFY
jgi:hypothetical protein